MGLRNTTQNYGVVARALHWTMAVAIVGLFALGLWMTDLRYDHAWYHRAPYIHKSIGILLAIALIVRFGWRWFSVHPDDSYLPPFERYASRISHRVMYLLLVVIVISGYLIATVDGHAVEVFGWFTVPSLLRSPGLEDVAGEVHEIATFLLIGLVVIHMLAACKHHFIDKDNTLKRMIGSPSNEMP